MGFHRRHISNDQVIKIYQRDGVEGVRDYYTKGVDALVTEAGLASFVTDILDIVGISNEDKWDKISKEIDNEII